MNRKVSELVAKELCILPDVFVITGCDDEIHFRIKEKHRLIIEEKDNGTFTIEIINNYFNENNIRLKTITAGLKEFDKNPEIVKKIVEHILHTIKMQEDILEMYENK